MSPVRLRCASLLLLGVLTARGQSRNPSPAAGAQTASRQAALTAFKAGSAAFTRGDLPAARTAFARAVRLAPQVAAAHGALGAVLLAQGNPLAARTELETARSLGPDDSHTDVSLAVARSETGDYAGSSALFHELAGSLDAAPDLLTRDTAIPLAAALQQTGDSAGAVALLTRAVQAKPLDASLQDALGTMQAAESHFSEAEQSLRDAIVLDPQVAMFHFHLGSVLLELHRDAQAGAELTQAHALDPRSATFSLQLARALMQEQKVPEAILLLQAALAEADPANPQTTDLRYRLALALQANDQVKEARPLFDQVIAARPNDVEALTNAGLDRVQLGDAAGGITLYQRALTLAPGNATLREDLGVAYLQQSDLDHALEQFRAGLKLDPENPALHYDLGLALKLKDDLAGAVPEFEQAASLDPTLPDPPYTLGILYMQQGRFADAARSLERAVALRPDNGDAWATLGSVYKQADQPEKAVAALRTAIRLLPTQPSPHITLAAILASQGNREGAATERKTGAALTRSAVNRQKADFGVDSGNLLLKRGDVAGALVQFADAVAADPADAAAHTGYALALDRSGRRAEAAEERRKAAAPGAAPDPSAAH